MHRSTKWSAFAAVLAVAVFSVPAAIPLASAAPGSAGPPATVSTDDARAADDHLDRLVRELHLPGITARVVDRDGTLWTGSRGQDGGGSDAITPTTPFLIGSVAKSLTAILVTRRLEAGRLGIDDPITDHLPWLRDADGVTVGELLTHTSGYTRNDGLAVAERFDTAPGAIRRAAEALRHSGSRGPFEYSDANYLVLGALVEADSGNSFADVLRDELTEPLGMHRTSAASAEATDLPAGHRFWFGHPRVYDPGFDDSGAPFGYVTSTLDDLTAYVRALYGSAPAVVSTSVVDSVTTPHVRGGTADYGYGWRIHPPDSDGLTVVDHTGATPGYFAHVLMRSDGRSAVVLADAYGESVAPTLADTAQQLLMAFDGGRPTLADGDTMLGALPWALSVLAGLGLVVAVLAVRRPRRVALRIAVLIGVVLVIVAVRLAPALLGVGGSQVRIWLPDSALALDVATWTWILAGVVLIVGGFVGHRRHRTPTGSTVVTDQAAARGPAVGDPADAVPGSGSTA
ncbi:hypothetical protein GS4_15_00545 [Gordonia soli NBRC 108243]|uniref:Beta-lactamase-related domain-containing protein n=1 Tax=Gordonia soli NBRC 108243 TaxID=1223545 RepID=M0QIZ5_9ACTN|nr:hypothetical protein GS4_15_00545 [Gordonia soli NBRC 108243]